MEEGDKCIRKLSCWKYWVVNDCACHIGMSGALLAVVSRVWIVVPYMFAMSYHHPGSSEM
jgi:hypothetical protein